MAGAARALCSSCGSQENGVDLFCGGFGNDQREAPHQEPFLVDVDIDSLVVERDLANAGQDFTLRLSLLVA